MAEVNPTIRATDNPALAERLGLSHWDADRAQYVEPPKQQTKAEEREAREQAEESKPEREQAQAEESKPDKDTEDGTDRLHIGAAPDKDGPDEPPASALFTGGKDRGDEANEGTAVHVDTPPKGAARKGAKPL